MFFASPSLLAIPALLAVSYAAPAPLSLNPRQVLRGQATFYTGNVQGGTCSFSTYTIPSNLYGTALSSSNWDNAAHCGQCISVTGPKGNSIRAMIVDQCPGCGTNHLDLFPNAFAALDNPTVGIINVDWTYLPSCSISSPLYLHNKVGASEYYFSMQIVNANKAVVRLDVSKDEGKTWIGTTRQSYNFFENGGLGQITGTVDIKVTSTNGKEIVVGGVNAGASGAQFKASKNF